MSDVRRARVARAFRRVALPLASYYAVTLALPLANGAAPSGAFMGHALVVLVVPPIAIILGCAVHAMANQLINGFQLVKIWFAMLGRMTRHNANL